jgi:hypothetical protein
LPLQIRNILGNPAFGNLPEENLGRAAIDRGVEMI